MTALNYHVLFFSYSGNGLNGPQNVFQKTGNLCWKKRPPLSLYKEACISQTGYERNDCRRVEFWLENEHELFVLSMYRMMGESVRRNIQLGWFFCFLEEYWRGIPHSKLYTCGRQRLFVYISFWREIKEGQVSDILLLSDEMRGSLSLKGVLCPMRHSKRRGFYDHEELEKKYSVALKDS